MEALSRCTKASGLLMINFSSKFPGSLSGDPKTSSAVEALMFAFSAARNPNKIIGSATVQFSVRLAFNAQFRGMCLFHYSAGDMVNIGTF